MVGVKRQLHEYVNTKPACSSVRSKRFGAVKEQKTRNESERPREKWGAYRDGDAHQELARIFRFIGWKQFSFRILYVLISYYMYFVSKKVF